MARWTGQGKDVSYLLATKGEAGIAGMSPDKTGPLRVEEEIRSAHVVGVSTVEFLDDHQDGLVEYGIALRHDLAAAFRRLQPEVVILGAASLIIGKFHDDGLIFLVRYIDNCNHVSAVAPGKLWIAETMRTLVGNRDEALVAGADLSVTEMELPTFKGLHERLRAVGLDGRQCDTERAFVMAQFLVPLSDRGVRDERSQAYRRIKLKPRQELTKAIVGARKKRSHAE